MSKPPLFFIVIIVLIVVAASFRFVQQRREKADNDTAPLVQKQVVVSNKREKPLNDRRSRQQEVSDLSRSLKLLAKDLDAPVIALAQLNRDVEKRVGKTPVLADLRESGGLEADADVVMLLSMDVETDPETGQEFESTSVVRMHVAKNRHGPLALLRMEREGHFARLREIQSLI